MGKTLVNLDKFEILKNHAAHLELDRMGNIRSFSKLASQHLIDLRINSNIKEFFPGLKLVPGITTLRPKKSKLIKVAEVQLVDSDSDFVDLFFSQSRDAIEEEYTRQMRLAEVSTLGELTSGIAHEISNPLTIISGFARHILAALQREKIESKTIESKTSKIISTVKRIDLIVSAIRKLSRGIKDDDPLLTTSIKEILNEALMLTTHRLASSSVDINIADYDKNIEISCQPVQVSQVLINLINNASDALSGIEKAQLAINLNEDSEDVVIQVKDNAAALKEDLYERIFEQNVTTKKLGEGSGIGLYLSRKIAHAHKGTLKAFVEDGWTIFEFRLPRTPHQSGVSAA